MIGDSEEAIAPAASTRRPHGKPVVRIVLEVLLIGVGVFLGLAGQQWRENVQHRELADATLRRFRTELVRNRAAVAGVKDKHVAKLDNLRAYFAVAPAVRQTLPLPNSGLAPAFFEYTAWDLALATQSLAYIDPDLVVSVSHVYAAQRQLDELTRAITQSMYATPSPTAFLGNVATYFGDCALHEPRLLRLYDEVLPRIDRALGDVAAR